MSSYLDVKASLEKAKCAECSGLGICNDADPGDMYLCEIKGSGFKNVILAEI